MKRNPSLSGVIDVVDFAAERNGEREINPAKLRDVVEIFSDPRYRLGMQDVEPDFQRLVDDAIGIDDGRAFVGAVRQAANLGPHLLRRARLELGNGGRHDVLAVAVEQHGEAALADSQRCCLRLDVADPLIGDADIGKDD